MVVITAYKRLYGLESVWRVGKDMIGSLDGELKWAAGTGTTPPGNRTAGSGRKSRAMSQKKVVAREADQSRSIQTKCIVKICRTVIETRDMVVELADAFLTSLSFLKVATIGMVWPDRLHGH
jgi:hypothetical protein